MKFLMSLAVSAAFTLIAASSSQAQIVPAEAINLLMNSARNGCGLTCYMANESEMVCVRQSRGVSARGIQCGTSESTADEPGIVCRVMPDGEVVCEKVL